MTKFDDQHGRAERYNLVTKFDDLHWKSWDFVPIPKLMIYMEKQIDKIDRWCQDVNLTKDDQHGKAEIDLPGWNLEIATKPDARIETAENDSAVRNSGIATKPGRKTKFLIPQTSLG